MGQSIEKEKNMSEKLKMNLLQGKYKDAEKICEGVAINDLRDIIIKIAYETESICVYSFVNYMIQKTKEIGWIELAIDIMINPLCFLEGAYSVALFHARELLHIEKSIKNLDRILFFYNIPEKLIDEEEVNYLIKEI